MFAPTAPEWAFLDPEHEVHQDKRGSIWCTQRTPGRLLWPRGSRPKSLPQGAPRECRSQGTAPDTRFTGQEAFLGVTPRLALKHCPGDNGGLFQTEDRMEAKHNQVPACKLSMCRAQSPRREGWGRGSTWQGLTRCAKHSWVTCSAGNEG